MTVRWFVLDALHANYASVLAALHTATAAKYSGTVTQSIRNAAHNANRKIVKANIEDDERVGALAPLHRDNYGVGVFKDEYPSHAEKDLEAFSLLGESGYVNKHFEQPFVPNASWVWSLKTLPDSDGSGRTYGDRIVGIKTGSGGFTAISAPATSKEDWFLHGWYIDVWRVNGGTVAGHASINLYNGQDANNKMNWRFDHWLKPGAITGGAVLQHNPWTKDGGSNAYFIHEDTGISATNHAHNSGNVGSAKHFDPNFDTFEFGGELSIASSVANCKATPGTSIWDQTLDGGNGGWWVHMPDGSNPTGRVVGCGDFGFGFSWRFKPDAAVEKRYIAFHGITGRQWGTSLKPSSGDIKIIEHIDFHMLNITYTTTTEDALVVGWVQDTGQDTAVRDILFRVDQMSRGQSAFYFISQSGLVNSGRFERITVEADPAAMDGRENIFDIGGFVPSEADNDGHAVGIQCANDFTVRNLKIRRTGGAIVAYAINFVTQGLNMANRPFTNLLVEGNDIAEHSEFYPQKGSSSASIAISLALDNQCVWDVGGAIVRDNILRGHDGISANAFRTGIRNQWHQQALLAGNDIDGFIAGGISASRTATIKYIDLTGASGTFAEGNRIANNAAPTTSIGIVKRVETPGATPRLYYSHATSQTTAPNDIAGGLTIINMDGSGTGTSSASVAVGVGPKTKIAASAARRSRIGNTGGTVRWIDLVSGAQVGGADVTHPYIGTYVDEQNTDFVGLASFAGINVPGHAVDTLANYQAFVDAGCVYGVGSVIVAP